MFADKDNSSYKQKEDSIKVRNRYLYITLLSILAWHAEAQGLQGTRKVPKLVVNITVDQLSSDYLDLFSPTYSENGFLKLLAEGLVFENASCGFTDIDASSAISSVVTGTVPFNHTITGNQWIDRKTLRPVSPTPEDLSSSTIGDELKRATHGTGKVYAVAASKAVAQLAGGHHPDGTFWNENAKKPWISSDITDKALRLITEKGLGQDSIPDMLLLTYDASDQNRQTYIQIDQELAKLVAQAEEQIGRGETLFLLSSTGYIANKSSDLERYHIPTGTFYINRAANLLNMYFGGLWGQEKYVEAYLKNQLYLNRQLIENKHVTIQDALQRAKEFLLQMAGVRQVSFHPFESHCGDLFIDLAPGWQIENEDTHEHYQNTTPLAYFPIIIYGLDFQPAHVSTPVTIDRIAPSISKAIRIRAPNACISAPLF